MEVNVTIEIILEWVWAITLCSVVHNRVHFKFLLYLFQTNMKTQCQKRLKGIIRQKRNSLSKFSFCSMVFMKIVYICGPILCCWETALTFVRWSRDRYCPIGRSNKLTNKKGCDGGCGTFQICSFWWFLITCLVYKKSKHWENIMWVVKITKSNDFEKLSFARLKTMWKYFLA